MLLDLNLGDDDGSTVAAQLRRSGFRRPIVLLSANQAGDQRPAADPQGHVDARWSKPISRAQLLEGLAELIG